jgi:hypothetical protein
MVDLNELDANDPDLPERHRKLLELKAEYGDELPDKIPYVHPVLQVAANLIVWGIIVFVIVKIVKWRKASS